jgi:glycosyltransferase involved in cell wall biosynthesis
MRFVILVTGYNCSIFVRNCLRSLSDQISGDFIAVLISDGSTDDTEAELLKWGKDSRFHFELHKDNQGAAKRRFDAIKKYATDPEDIICLLGMDDSLSHDCLSYVQQEYRHDKWMTYGNWKDQFGQMLPETFPLDFDDYTHNNRYYRTAVYRSTALNTFKRFLFDQMTEEDFKVDGEWIRATTESPVMLACLEMCGRQRIGIIERPIYFYNKRFAQSTRKRIGNDIQRYTYNEITKREKFPLYEGKQR